MAVTYSKPCPRCRQVMAVDCTDDQRTRLKGGALIQDVFPEMKPHHRERFISGYCPDCWNNLFGTEVQP